MDQPEQLLLQKIQVILAEQRTYFSILRTGLVIITVPLTIVVFLVATKEYHDVFNHPGIMILVVGVLLFISLSGFFITFRSFKKIQKLNKIAKHIEQENRDIDEIIV